MRHYLQTLIISGGFLLLLFFSGCSEQSEVVIQKTEAIPEDGLSSETSFAEEVLTETSLQEEIITPVLTKKTPSPVEQATPPPKSASVMQDTPIVKETEPVEDSTLIAKSEKITIDEEDEPTDPSQSSQSARAPISKATLLAIPGECIVYTVRWNFAHVGKLLLACKKEKLQGSDVYHFVGITLPEGLMTKVGYGYNRFDSYVDVKTNLPFYYYGYYAGRKSSQITTTRINQRKKELTYETKKYRNNVMYAKTTNTVPFTSYVYDGLSVFYGVRGMNIGDPCNFSLPVGITKVWNLRVSFIEKKTQTFPSVGRRNYVLLHTEGDEDQGIFKAGKLMVGISADEEKIPLFFRGSVPLGTANIDIVARVNMGDKLSLDSKSLTNLLLSLSKK